MQAITSFRLISPPYRSIIVFRFIFLFRLGLLTALTAIKFPAEPGTILTRRALKSGLTSADSRLQLDLEIALTGNPQRRSSPTSFFSPAEDALKRRVTQSSRLYQ